MAIRLFSKTAEFARRCSTQQPAGWGSFTRDTIAGFMTTAHHAVMMLGIGAIAAWGVLFIKPEIADQLKALSPFATTTAAAPQSLSVAAPPLTNLLAGPSHEFATQDTEPQMVASAPTLGNANVTPVQQQRVIRWISSRYRVSGDATNMLVSAAYVTAKELKLDPLLILAVVAIESRFNPFAESPMGAQGLMQVMSKIHHKKFQALGGPQAALNPVANIKVGAEILKDYVRRGGSLEAGLKMYVGAGNMDTDGGYGARVLAEYSRLTQVAMGKKIPIYDHVVSTVAAKAVSTSQKADLPVEADAVPATTSNTLPQHDPALFTTAL